MFRLFRIIKFAIQLVKIGAKAVETKFHNIWKILKFTEYSGISRCHQGQFQYKNVVNNVGILIMNSSPPGQNGRHFGRQHFQMHFL